MSQDNPMRITDIDFAEPGWNSLYKVAGVSALLALIAQRSRQLPGLSGELYSFIHRSMAIANRLTPSSITSGL